jgi:RNA polymerase-binding transcription factor DksA
MSPEEFASPAAMAPTRTHSPYWRARLDSRWRACLREVIELSLAYHAAAGEPGGSGDRAAQPEAQTLLNRAVAARRELADVEDALGRLTAGNFGACEQCGTQIPAGLLADNPETRYCAHCDILPGCTEPARMHASRAGSRVALRLSRTDRGATAARTRAMKAGEARSVELTDTTRHMFSEAESPQPAPHREPLGVGRSQAPDVGVLHRHRCCIARGPQVLVPPQAVRRCGGLSRKPE